MVTVSVFGGFAVEVDGVSRGASVPRRLAAIVGVLALHGERGVSRERLLHLLWSEGEPERARHALTQSLYALRRLLGVDDAIQGTAQLALNPERVRTDIAELERALATHDAPRALATYRGPLLDGFSVAGAPELERWLDEQRSHYAQRLASFLDTRARSLHGEGQHAEAVNLLRRRAALDPLDATAALTLMRGWAQAGDTPAAVQHARVYAELVRQELDLEPDPRVDALARELRDEMRQRPAPAPKVSPATASLESASDGWRRRAVALRSRMAVAAAVGVQWWRRRSRRWRMAARQGATVSVALVITLLALARLGSTRRGAASPPRATAVLPFRATGLSADLSFLPVGIVDLLSVAMAERDTLAVVDPELVHRWWRGVPAGEGFTASDSVVDLAGSLGARQFVTGTLVGNARQVVIRATLVDAATRRQVAVAAVNGSLDSLPRLVDRVATLLVATAAGAGEAVRFTPDADAGALRAYLRGRAAYQRADFRVAQELFANALARDSSLASASIGLALAADWLEDSQARAGALEVATRWRDRLPTIEQLQLVALRGVRYPEPSLAEEHFAAWERVARIGERAELWADLGRRLLVDGRLAGLSDAEVRARDAFAHALVLDSSNVGARLSLITLSAGSPYAADLASQQLEGDGSDLSLWLNWRQAARSRDARALDRARAGFQGASDDALRRIALTALSDGDLLEDGVRALGMRGGRARGTAARVDAVLAEHAYALNTGSPTRALLATRRLGDLVTHGAHLRLRILDALYADGDSAAAIEAVSRLTSALERSLLAGGDSRAAGLADLCALEQWRVWHGDYSNVEATVRMLASDEAGPVAAPVVAGSVACARVLDALAEGLRGVPGASDALARAEQLAMSGPAAGDLRQYATLALARVRERRGDYARAYALVHRRSTARGWPRYLSSYLHLEASLAERMLDTAAATAALRHYVALRSAADSSGSADLELARTRLRQLQGQL